jgi:hypothetical protein
MSRLTIRLASLLAVTLSLPVLHAQVALPAKDMDELAHYTLTMDNLVRVMQASRDIAALTKTNPKIAAAVQASADKNQGLADIDRRIASYPQLTAIFAAHNLTGHEFVVAELTLFQSMLAYAGKQSGADPVKLAADGHVNPANITFVEQHKAELDQLQKKYPMDGGN